MISDSGVGSPQPRTQGKNYSTPVTSRKPSMDKPEHESPLVANYEVDMDGSTLSASGGGKLKNKYQESSSLLSYTLVWSPLPPITWLIPFIGHTGICDSSGIASDFRGPYYVGDDGRMAFGPPTRFLKIDLEGVCTAEQWDAAIQEANQVYRGRMHNICCDNCHSHVAYALNHLHVSAYGIQKWNMVNIAMIMFLRSSFLSWTAVLQQFLPFTLMVVLIVVVSKLA
jgi:transmembrane protein 222